MTKQNSLLHIGIANFAEPTLLLMGDKTSLLWLAEQVNARRNFKITEMCKIYCDARVALHLIPASHKGGLTRLGDAFEWELSAVDADKFTQQLKELADAASPAHTYLDSESNAANVQVVASKGEYDPEKVFIQ
jgi:3-deoxy-D-arabino-heptulosonate 7-phosphate (DAHP) synthase class II